MSLLEKTRSVSCDSCTKNPRTNYNKRTYSYSADDVFIPDEPECSPTFNFSLNYIPEEFGIVDKVEGQGYSNGLSNTLSKEALDLLNGYRKSKKGQSEFNESHSCPGDLRERITMLEEIVKHQADELVVLKTALADVIRRLNVTETYNQGVAEQKPISKKNSLSYTNLNKNQSSMKMRSTSMDPIAPKSATRKTPPQLNTINSKKRQLSNSSKNSTSQTNGTVSNVRSHHKDASYDQDEGFLKFYIRGRSIQMFAPTSLMSEFVLGSLPQPSSERMKLEWVYGYRGRDARSNLHQIPTGEMVYFIASTVILFNPDTRVQRHYLGHTDDIKCIAIHPGRITIATGQVAGHDDKEGKPHIRIWDSVSLNTLKVIGLTGEFDRAVACVAFSVMDGGSQLIAIDDGNEHTISLWQWQRGYRVIETKSSTEAVLAAEFHPCDGSSIITCGKNQLSFWKLEGGTLSRKLGIYEKYEKPKYVTCFTFSESIGDLITADSNGNIFIWARGNNKITSSIQGAHDGSVFSLCVTSEGHLLSGGKDRHIHSWDGNYKRIKGSTYELEAKYGGVRMISHGSGQQVIIGTTRNTILRGTFDLGFSVIVEGHVGDVYGLAIHPNQPQFLTCGYDGNMFLWDTLTHSAIWSISVQDEAHCISFHPDGLVAALGDSRGCVTVVDITSHCVLSQFSATGQLLTADEYTIADRVECLTYSPDGTKLAIGCHDSNIYIYSLTKGNDKKYAKIGKCSGHSSFISHVDWSSDSLYIQTNSGNISSCKQITASSTMRDVLWSTHTCTLAFNVCGIWPSGADGTDVNACTRSNKHDLVASADDFGKVNLYTYPCSQPQIEGRTYSGHSSHVTNISFSNDDSRIISTGGKDMAILQWQITS